jgi:hypothetical protein
MSKQKHDTPGGGGISALRFVFAAQLPHLSDVLQEGAADFSRLTLYRREEYEVLGVLKRMDSEGASEVAFGAGTDVLAALFALEGALKRGGWQVDKPAPWETGK